MGPLLSRNFRRHQPALKRRRHVACQLGRSLVWVRSCLLVTSLVWARAVLTQMLQEKGWCLVWVRSLLVTLLVWVRPCLRVTSLNADLILTQMLQLKGRSFVWARSFLVALDCDKVLMQWAVTGR